jgi:hypothetical protein
MRAWFSGFLGWLWKRLDAVLPGPPDEAMSAASEADSDRRKLRIRLHMLEKRGKGGGR